ncbi:ZPR1 zinc finger domain-containing protein [Thermogladius sp. 4427co]|uniref:ZPR1 zinc finger domain-containing protein n=1 Tax=Thermogladius sp. 4427co TaxID=3450718 RepID=UPI003F79A827
MEDREPVKILEYNVKCPVCGSDAIAEEYLYEAPLVGQLLLTTVRCPRCGFKHRDVMSLDFGEPVEITYRIEKPGDERALFVRSSTASISIPELEIEITPGAMSQGEITTIEGILLRIIDLLRNNCESDNEICSDKIAHLSKAANGEMPLTIIVRDPFGGSKIFSNKAIVRKVGKEEK